MKVGDVIMASVGFDQNAEAPQNEDVARPDVLENAASHQRRARKRKWFARMDATRRIPTDVRGQISNMFCCTYLCLRGLLNYSFAFDVSHIGGLSRLLGVVATSDWRAGWALPMVAGSIDICVFLYSCAAAAWVVTSLDKSLCA